MDNTLRQLIDEILKLNFSLNQKNQEIEELKEVNQKQAQKLKEEENGD